MSTHTHAVVIDADQRRRLGRRARLLAGTSVAYNVAEAVVAITAGLVAGSVALLGFGLDSVVEVSSGLVVLWQFRHPRPESRELRAQRLMAGAFLALAVVVTFESTRALVTGREPESSPVGIGLAALSLVVMPVLSWAQRRTGRALGSGAVVADSTQTLLCTCLSAVVLAGLLLNAGLGWAWADPLAGLVVAGIALREARDTWRGEGCCGPEVRPSLDLLVVDSCTLPTLEQPLRLAEFDALFRDAVRGVERADDVVRLHLSGPQGLLERTRDLTDRESACCSFFDFRLTGTDVDAVLEVRVPPSRRAVLAALADRADAARA